MNNKLFYLLIFIFLAAVIIFNIFLKTQPNLFNNGMHTMVKSSELLV